MLDKALRADPSRYTTTRPIAVPASPALSEMKAPGRLTGRFGSICYGMISCRRAGLAGLALKPRWLSAGSMASRLEMFDDLALGLKPVIQVLAADAEMPGQFIRAACDFQFQASRSPPERRLAR